MLVFIQTYRRTNMTSSNQLLMLIKNKYISESGNSSVCFIHFQLVIKLEYPSPEWAAGINIAK